jgi:hypothetical protein
MSLVVTTIPERTADLAHWLERHLVGLDLARLVSELSAIHDLPADRLPVESVLAGHLEAIYQGGLSVLPRELLRHLLTHPALLLELQELILVHGGPYWDSFEVRENPRVDSVAEHGRARLPGRMRVPAEKTVAWYTRPWAVSLATAAAVLVAVGVWTGVKPAAPQAQTAWGWDRPGALPQDADRKAYLEALADAAGDWFKKRPETAPDLARRIGQFRQGCSTLLLTEHVPLTELDRQWLKERCRLWAGKLDRQLADLEAGKAVAAVRAETDATVKQLAAALRQRAQAA